MPDYYHYEEYSHRRRDRDESPDYHRDTLRLEPPSATGLRPRSVPPPNNAVVARPRPRSPSLSSYDSDEGHDSQPARRNRSPSPVTKARNVVQDNFSSSAAGVGAGLLGAMVGGFVARQASDAVARRKQDQRGRRRSSHGKEDDNNTTRIVSTLLGAVAGGFGANALANHVEDSRDRDRARQVAWEQRHGREEDLPHYDTGRKGDLDHRNGRGVQEDSDDEYDYVYDRRDDDRQPRRRRSDDDYRYRN